MWKIQIQSLAWGDPLEKGMATTPIFLPRESHGQSSLEGNSPRDHKESDTTDTFTCSQGLVVFSQYQTKSLDLESGGLNLPTCLVIASVGCRENL